MSITEPAVSVVIPVRGHAGGLAAAIHSALAQSLPPLEVIVVDDGNSPPIALPITDPRVRLERIIVNSGPSAARNLGCHVARGNWIAFLDDDDLWRADKLAMQLAGHNPANDILLACNVLVVDAVGRRPLNTELPTAPLDQWLLVEDHAFQTSGLVLPRALAQRFPFDTRLQACEDWDFVLRLDAAGITTEYREECLVSYHRDKGSRDRLKQRMPSVLMWLDGPAGTVSPAVRLHYYAHHIFIPHLRLNPAAALATLWSIARNCPSPGAILRNIVWRKLYRSRTTKMAG